MSDTAVTGLSRRPMRVGFIGGGFMAEVHSRAARAARANLVGIVSSSPERSEAAAGALGIERAYPSIEAMLSDDRIDVVHVVTPNTSHLEHALAAIMAGKHVICEKPLATSVADARQLASAAVSSGVTATVPFVYRFHPMVREARARVLTGEFGRLLSVQGTYLQDWLLAQTDGNWRVDAASGGPSRAFADIGSHLCDLLEFVTGDRIARVQALKRTVFESRPDVARVTTEDLVAVLFETRAGAVGTLLVSQVAPGRKNRLQFEIAGSGESIGFDQENPDLLWIGRRQASEILARGENMSEDAARLSVLPAGHPLGYQDAFSAFVADSYAAIAGDSRDGLPTFADGLRAVRLTDAVLESAGTGAWVDIEGELA